MAETEQQVKWWIKHEQEQYSVTEKFLEDQERLNPQKNNEGIYVCRGRIQGHYLVNLLPRVTLSETIMQEAHLLTLHGGVGSTMAHVRQEYWIPCLCQLAKNVIQSLLWVKEISCQKVS